MKEYHTISLPKVKTKYKRLSEVKLKQDPDTAIQLSKF
jgi:hypothetical protein